MNRRYLVCRKDAIRGSSREMISNSCFPILVEYDSCPGDDSAESIVRKAFDTINQGYIGMHEYIVIPMHDALLVSFRPKANYEVSVRNF